MATTNKLGQVRLGVADDSTWRIKVFDAPAGYTIYFSYLPTGVMYQSRLGATPRIMDTQRKHAGWLAETALYKATKLWITSDYHLGIKLHEFINKMCGTNFYEIPPEFLRVGVHIADE